MGLKSRMKPQLSIIIVSYNTATLTCASVQSIVQNYSEQIKKGSFEIIVSDNGSVDNTIESLKRYRQQHDLQHLTIIENGDNLGFSKANNVGVKCSKGKYLLFLNPDTIVYPKTLDYMLSFMHQHPNAGAATCKLEMLNKEIDYASHRGFPTPWNSFCFFSKLSRLFPNTKGFNGYTLSHMDMNTTHEVDAISGAFLLMPRHIGEQVGWWDEDYFFNGEDLDLCYKIKQCGYKIYYIPHVTILHYNGAASGIKKSGESVTTATLERKWKMQSHRFEAMKIFYKKHYIDKYPRWTSWLVFKGIDLLHRRACDKISKMK